MWPELQALQFEISPSTVTPRECAFDQALQLRRELADRERRAGRGPAPSRRRTAAAPVVIGGIDAISDGGGLGDQRFDLSAPTD